MYKTGTGTVKNLANRMRIKLYLLKRKKKKSETWSRQKSIAQSIFRVSSI